MDLRDSCLIAFSVPQSGRLGNKSLSEKCPRESHTDWQEPHDRPDPVLLLEQSSQGGIPELTRHNGPGRFLANAVAVR